MHGSASPQESHIATASPSSHRTTLTRENLHRLDEITGTASIPGAPNNASRSQSKSSSTHTQTPTNAAKALLSPTTPEFAQKYLQNGNLDIIDSSQVPLAGTTQAQILSPRSSPSPPPEAFTGFIKHVQRASTKTDLARIFDRRILKALDDDGNNDLLPTDYEVRLHQPWTAFPQNVGFNNGLAAPRPARVEGFLASTFPPPILAALGGSVTPVENGLYPLALPHFAIEFTDAGNDMQQRAPGYAGAAMVYARNRALAFLGQRDPPRWAAVVTASTDGHAWNAYAHYALKSEGSEGRLEYYQYPLASGSWYPRDEYERGYRVLRNLQEYGFEQSVDLRARLRLHFGIYGAVAAPSILKTSDGYGAEDEKGVDLPGEV